MSRPGRNLLAAGLCAAFALSCTAADVTPLGAKVPAKPEGCAVEVYPATEPPYAYENVASVRVGCEGRSRCIDRLREEACKAGADTVYRFAEGMTPTSTVISATLARKTGEKTGEKTAEVSKAASGVSPAVAPSDACTPPCSPGFACKAGMCEPQCNPACEKGEVCTRKRTCEPVTGGK
jgi:hypothetical protein